MEIKLKKLNENARLPEKKHTGDFCYDVYATSEEEVAPNVWKYGLGFAYEMDRKTLERDISAMFPFGTFVSSRNLNIDIDFRPRSSVWKTGMLLSNSIGTLDEFYRNEVGAVFYHIFPNMPRYKVGERIGQIKLGITFPMKFAFVEEIDENTERGKGGFGSTGNK